MAHTLPVLHKSTFNATAAPGRIRRVKNHGVVSGNTGAVTRSWCPGEENKSDGAHARRSLGFDRTTFVNGEPSFGVELFFSVSDEPSPATRTGKALGRRRHRWTIRDRSNDADASEGADEQNSGTSRRKSLRKSIDVNARRASGVIFDGMLRPTSYSRIASRTRPLVRLSIIAKLTIFCQRLAQSPQIFRNNPLHAKIVPFLNSIQFAVEANVVANSDLLFDRTRFKVNRRLLCTEDAKRVLLKQPWQRGEKELLFLIRELHDIKSFAELPVRMQHKVAEVARYERFEKMRLIVMQNDPAWSFYFILSGSVVVALTEDDSSITRPVVTLTRGMTFGELAIINRTERQSTIIVKEDVELMCIDIEDYHKIFMLGGTRNVTDPDHVQFIRSLPFLDGWPIERMIESATKCIFHYFKRGEILVRNSQQYSWIIIVKSGSLKVLKKLKRVNTADLKEYDKRTTVQQLPDIDEPLLRRYNKRRLQPQQRHLCGRLPPVMVPLNDTKTTTAATMESASLPDDTPPPATTSYLDHHVTGAPRRRRHAVATRDELVELSVARVLGGKPAHVATASAVGISDDDSEVGDGYRRLAVASTTMKGFDDGAAAVQRSMNFHRHDFTSSSASMSDGACVDEGQGHGNVNYDSDGGGMSSSKTVDESYHRLSTGDSSFSERMDHDDMSDDRMDCDRDKLHPSRTIKVVVINNLSTIEDDDIPENFGEKKKIPTSLTGNKATSGRRGHKSTSSKTVTKSGEGFHEPEKLTPPGESQSIGLRTITADINSYKRGLYTTEEITDADINPEFIHVQTLVRGQVFGLSDVILGGQPSLSVISNGAECILLDKQFYEQNAPEALLQRLRFYECCPYPTDDEMQHRLLMNVRWAKYRQKTLNDVVDHRPAPYRLREFLDKPT